MHSVAASGTAWPPDDVSARIQTVLDDRRRSVPGVRAEIEWWLRVDDQLAALAAAVRELGGHPHTPAELRDALAGFRVEEAREGVADAVQLLRVLESRFSRTTINIGVSGQARVGKSTLLQSISGLDDGQIPTGKGLPVTAVRSRIFHSRSNQRATLRLHTFDTFVADVLAPHHAQLGLPGLPTSASGVRRLGLPDPRRARRADPTSPATPPCSSGCGTCRPRCPATSRTWSAASARSPSTSCGPTSPTRRNDELGGPDPVSRRYLAVRDLRIECAFPHAKVEQLAVVDLPGLGEVAVGAEAHHIDGLQNEVDVVLLVKRAMGDEAYWGEADARTLDLLDIARGFVAKRDFVFLVLNQGGIDPDLQRTLRDDVNREINMGEPDRFFQVLETDAADERRRVRPGARPRCCATSPSGCRRWTPRCWPVPGPRRWPRRTGSSCWPPTSGGSSAPCGPAPAAPRRTCSTRAKRLRQDLAAGLQELVARLHEQAREASEDPEFVAAVEQVYAANREWITGGLGRRRADAGARRGCAGCGSTGSAPATPATS